MPSKSAKHRKALREIAISNLKKDRNFFVVGLTYGCLRSWKRMCSAPMAFRIFSWGCRKESGSNMVPVLGDTNR